MKIFPQIDQKTFIEIRHAWFKKYSIIHAELRTILRKQHTDGEFYDFDVIRRIQFRESSTLDTLNTMRELYQIFIFDVITADRHIIIHPELLDSTEQPIFRKVDKNEPNRTHNYS